MELTTPDLLTPPPPIDNHPPKPKPKPPKDDGTTLKEMYDFFLAGITDDMFMEITLEDTMEILDELLRAALPNFEFPRKNIYDIDWYGRSFNVKLTTEEMLIIRQYMIVAWIGYQLASIENIRQKYSSSDFAFTSQASHISQLVKLKQEYEDQGFHLQRLYCRRKVDENGVMVPLMDTIMASSLTR